MPNRRRDEPRCRERTHHDVGEIARFGFDDPGDDPGFDVEPSARILSADE
ncbi:hypothetical protein [Nocardia sp. NPDC052112]